ncbi:sialate O-acetylesterase [Diplocloster hominis]|uniref:sialate O-acetylesterase n=1 Tax=Diplocloster hominis TaxID=3079010 RepID=UPI0031BA0CA6
MWKKCRWTLAVIIIVCFCTSGMLAQAEEPPEENEPILDFNMDHLENGSVTNAADSRTFAVQGNSPVLVQGKDDQGKALQFDGSTNYINLGTDYQVTSGKTTIAAWVKLDPNPNGLSRIICRSRTPVVDEKDLSLYIRNNGALEAQISNTGWTAANPGTVTFGQWQHVAVTNDGTTQILYLNGDPVKTETISGGPADQWNVPLLIGGGWNTQATAPFEGHMFKGAIDDLKVYDQALSDGDIKKLAEINGIRVEIETPKSDQIIQREEDGTAAIPIRGKLVGNQSADVEITLLDTAGEKVAGFEPVQADISEGTFQAEIQRVPAGLYQIQVSGKNNETTIFQSSPVRVGVGDLWIIAGQSNAAGYGRYLPDEEIKSAADDPSMEGVNLYRWASGTWCQASQPIGEVQSPENHAPGLTFAKEISRAENVPVGILQVAVGGSSISDWLKGKPYYERILNCFDSNDRRAKGIFWYQGEAETLSTTDGSIPQENVDAYPARFTRMVEDLRADFNNPGLTVITAQLNSHADRDQRHPPASLWYQMKEIQRQLGDPESEIYIPNTAVISTSGLRLSDGIHNSANSNVILAKRMAQAALALAYKKEISWEQPSLSHGIIKDRTVLLTFRYADDGLKSNRAVTDFTIQDDSGAVPIISTQIDGCHVKLTVSREFSGAVKVDGLASVKPSPTIFNQRDEPILAFYHVPAEAVNTKTLLQLVKNAEKITENIYTAGSWDCLQNVLADAKAALQNEYSTQEETNEKADLLFKAIEELVTVKNLNDLYQTNKDKNNNNYTASSWTTFQNALKKAKEILEDPKASQEQVDTAYNNLVSAVKCLQAEPVKKDRLLQLYQANKDKKNDGYTDDSWTTFQNAIAVAKDRLDNPQTTQQQADQALSDLQKAIDSLKTEKKEPGGTKTEENKIEENKTEENKSEGTPSAEETSRENIQAPPTGDGFNYLLNSLMIAISGGTIIYIWKRKKLSN